MEINILIYFIVLYLTGELLVIEGEETPFSYENNRVVKLLALQTSSKKENKSTLPLNMNELENIRVEVKQLKMVIAQIKQMSTLEEVAEKCVSSIKRRNEFKAQRHWDQIIQTLESNPTESSNILRRIAVEAYDGFRENIIPVVHFINYTRDLSALSILLEEMREYGHLYQGTEVFLFAKLIRTYCGVNSLLYQELPIGIQYVDSYSVRLLNENNDGALFYKPKEYCRGRHCTNDEVFTFHSDIDDLPEPSRSKASWVFEPTNETEYSDNIKFHLRNEFGNDSYFYSTYYTRLSQTQKSVLIVQLVNNTEDAVRIRVEETHLVKKLIMGKQNTGSNTLGLSIMYSEDRFDKANDGNWVVHPLNLVRQHELNGTNDAVSFKCQFIPNNPETYSN